MPPWNTTKAKIQLRICVQKLRLIQEKKEAQAKTARREIATLLEQKKLEKARVKVESIISEDVHVELLELLELYCELLIARTGLLEQNTKEPDPGISEGVCSLIHAAPRTELKELHVLRDMLMHKYGREFSIAVMENRGNCVSERVMKKIEYKTPPSELVDAYLGEIAKGYGLDWAPEQTDDGDSGGGGGLKESIPTPVLEAPLSPSGKITAADISPSLPDIPLTEELEKVKFASDAAKPATTPAPPQQAKPEDEFEALARRFEALKRR